MSLCNSVALCNPLPVALCDSCHILYFANLLHLVIIFVTFLTLVFKVNKILNLLQKDRRGGPGGCNTTPTLYLSSQLRLFELNLTVVLLILESISQHFPAIVIMTTDTPTAHQTIHFLLFVLRHTLWRRWHLYPDIYDFWTQAIILLLDIMYIKTYRQQLLIRNCNVKIVMWKRV